MGNGVEGKGNKYNIILYGHELWKLSNFGIILEMRTLYYCKFESILLNPRRFLLKNGILFVVLAVIKKAMEYGIGLCLNLSIRLTVKKCIRVVNFLNIYKTIIATIDLF